MTSNQQKAKHFGDWQYIIEPASKKHQFISVTQSKSRVFMYFFQSQSLCRIGILHAQIPQNVLHRFDDGFHTFLKKGIQKYLRRE
jgi:hypothetical protein